MKLLEIQSSPRGESSDSIALTQSFIEACKCGSTSIVVDTLNVRHEGLPEFDYEAIGAKYDLVIAPPQELPAPIRLGRALRFGQRQAGGGAWPPPVT
jgi:FMN-dependent NADH-azoreductase